MIVRYYAACGTCKNAYMLRIQMGIRKNQAHIFHCVSCSESIEVKLVEGEGILPGVNCVPIVETVGALPYYLSSDFVASAEELHDPTSMPSFAFIKGLHQKFSASRLIDHEVPFSLDDRRSDMHPELMWPKLQKAWRLPDAGQFSLANAILGEIEDEPSGDKQTLSDAKFGFLGRIVKFDEALLEEVRQIKSGNEHEFMRLIAYYQTHFRPMHTRDFYAVISEFFESFDDFSQALLYLKFGTSLPRDAKATSVNFDGVKKFYATCYEFYAGAIVLYTCMNNIKNGRDFDKLARVNLTDYMRTDKAERRKSLENNKIFHEATKEFDNTIRNASFHNWFRLKDTKCEIEYRSGGTGALKTLTYIEYLSACCNLFGQTCQLFMVELLLDETARINSYVTVAK